MLQRLTLGVCACVLAACTAYDAHNDLAAAEQALTSAERAGAPRYAQYEYTAAAEYLHKAKEEAAYSDYEGARVFAKRAQEYADRAETRAGGERMDGKTPPPPPPPPSAEGAK